MSNDRQFVTLEDYYMLRLIYKQAVKEGRKEFKYKGMDFVTDYAKYLLECMEGYIKKDRDRKYNG